MKDATTHQAPGPASAGPSAAPIGSFTASKIGPAVAADADDPDAQVRQQVAYSLGYWDDPKAAETLGHMAVKNADDPYITAAVLSSLTEKNLPGVLATVLKEAGENGPPPAFVAQLMRMAAATKNDKAQAELLTAASDAEERQVRPLAVRGPRGRLLRPAAKLDPAGRLREPASPRPQTAALRVVTDPEAPEADRIAALRSRRPRASI